MNTPTNKILANIQIVLVKPQIADNIGLVARVMKNTRFNNLAVVTGCLAKKSFEVAKGARDTLEGAKVFATVKEALGSSHFIFGTTRRKREYKFVYNLNDILPFLVSLACRNKISIIFGQENFGLSRDDIEACESIFYIPANQHFPSYNLASAVGIVCYEIFNWASKMRQISRIELAARQDIETLFSYLKSFLSKHLDERRTRSAIFFLKRVILRTPLTKNEVSLIKGIILKRLS